jgi:hypothetical protein
MADLILWLAITMKLFIQALGLSQPVRRIHFVTYLSLLEHRLIEYLANKSLRRLADVDILSLCTYFCFIVICYPPGHHSTSARR